MSSLFDGEILNVLNRRFCNCNGKYSYQPAHPRSLIRAFAVHQKNKTKNIYFIVIQIANVKFNIWPQFECQSRISKVNIRYSVSLIIRIRSRILYDKKYDIRPQFESQNRTSNI